MDKFKYIDLIKAVQNEETIKLVGEIDVNLLKSQKLESLYYSFPLIERLVLEIYKLVPYADIECYTQGVMKTINSIIDTNSNDVLPENTINIIKKYFKDDGLRNKLFHNKDGSIKIKISFNEINFLIMQLLSILKQKLLENNDFDFKDIELFKI